ncbi:MAG: AAA family ATPase [Rudaea sp.]|uniref:AAA family ATPase n=1 Tax=Rudaea sp. TaxID=2136325 RepID=UPI0039E56F28
MIVLLTGPTGVGKTDTSWALIELAAPMVFLDCDWFASRIPFSWKSAVDVETVFQALSILLRYHIGRGSTRFVISLTVEMAQSFKQNRHYFDEFHLPMHHLQLRCTEDVLRHRILQRDRMKAQQDAELAVMREQQISFETLTREFAVVETSQIDERAAAEKIWHIVNRANDAPTSPARITPRATGA